MSDYRDDSNDTAVIGDETWLGLKNFLVEEFATISAVALVTIGTLVTDTAQAGDETWVETTRHSQVVETATASDETWDALKAKQLVVETRRVSESLTHSLGVLHEDTAQVSDELAAGVRELVTDTAQASEVWSGVLRASILVQDSIKVSDSLVYHGFTLVEDNAAISDVTTGKLWAWELLSDAAQISDEVVEGAAASALVTDTATVSDEMFGTLHATQVVEEFAQVEDSVGADTGATQVWTANTFAEWATSRYLLNATGIASVDGVLYLTTTDGVYALDGVEGEVEGRLLTGRIDVGGGSLATPVGMYLEYELDGALEVEVTQHQSGIDTQSYTYDLPTESADTLTNGRVMFGKGLRGRHFTFELTITGRHAYINDMSLLVAPIKRRV